MKTMNLLSVSCAALVALHTVALAGGEGWTSDFDAAKKQAAEEKKDLLIDFTGSDWCGWCIKLNDEVFKHDAFKTGVKDNFVLVEIDFPKDKSKLSEATQEQNEELGGKYSVQGYPTILLTDATGRPYGRTGYREGGPEKYVEHLDELREGHKKSVEAFAAAAKLDGVPKAEALVAALDDLGLEDPLLNEFYGDVIEQIKAADPDDKTGFTAKAETGKRVMAFQKELESLARKQDMDGALKLVEKTLAEGGLPADEMQKITMTKAIVLAEKGQFDDAIKAADEAKAIAPESGIAEGIARFRQQLEGAKAAAEAGPETAPEEEAPKAE